MKLGSTVDLPNESGHHVALDDKPCSGRMFQVVTVGVGGIYHDVVQCGICHRQLKVYGNNILDPFAERLLNIPDDQDAAIAGIKLSYRYVHGNANGQSVLPSKWFNDLAKAVDAFSGITEEAARSAWPRHDMTDQLTRVVVELYRKTINEWERMDYREYEAA